MKRELTWLGHSAFLVRTPGLSFVIDPFLEGNPYSPVKAKDIKDLNIVLVTHDHADHLGQAVEICKANNALLLGIVETVARLVEEEGLPGELAANGIGINMGGTFRHMAGKFKMVQAVHSSRTGAPAGYIITMPDGFTIYHAGDTAIFGGMELLGRLHKIDLALLPTGGIFTMDSLEAALAVTLLKPKKVLPMHWGTFEVLEKNTDIFVEELEKRKKDLGEIEILTPKPGEALAI